MMIKLKLPAPRAARVRVSTLKPLAGRVRRGGRADAHLAGRGRGRSPVSGRQHHFNSSSISSSTGDLSTRHLLKTGPQPWPLALISGFEDDFYGIIHSSLMRFELRNMASEGEQTASLLKMSEEAVIQSVAESVKGLSATFCCGGSIPLQSDDNIRLYFQKVRY